MNHSNLLSLMRYLPTFQNMKGFYSSTRISILVVVLAAISMVSMTSGIASAQDRLAGSVYFEKPAVHPGETVGLAVVLDMQTGWHVYPGKGSPDEVDGYIPTTIEVDLPKEWELGPAQWPKAHDMLFGPVGFQEQIRVYEGRAVVYFPITIPKDANPGDPRIRVTIGYQSCDDSICEMPTSTDTTTTLKVVETGTAISESVDESIPPSKVNITQLFAGYVKPMPASENPQTDEAVNDDLPSRVDLSLVMERSELVPGDQVGLAIIMNIHETWHIEPGEGTGEEADYPSRITLQLPEGWKASAIQWPSTVRVPAPGGGVTGSDTVAAYQGRVVAYVGITLPTPPSPPTSPTTVEPKTYHLSATLRYQACDPNVCELPNQVSAESIIKVLSPGTQPTDITSSKETSDLFKSFDRMKAFASTIGDDNDNTTDDTKVRAHEESTGHSGIAWGPIRWYGVGLIVTVAMLFMVVQTLRITKRFTIIIMIFVIGTVVTAGAWSFISSAVSEPEGWVSFTRLDFEKAQQRGDLIVVDFTAEWCLNCKTVEKVVLHKPEFLGFIRQPGVTAFIADITTGREEGAQFKNEVPKFGGGIPILAIYQPNDPEPVIFQGLYTLSPVMDALHGKAQHISTGHVFDFFGWRFSIGKNGWPIVLFIAALAGFFLNLTPCVLPVIPIKILSLQSHAGHPAKCFSLGLVFGLGIVTMFAVLGILMGGLITGMEKLQWGEFFQFWWANLLLGLIILVMALGMFGAFSTNLPDWVYMFNPQSDSAKGSFMLGILTAVLATPCAGPLLGAALTWAATQPAWLAMMMFIFMGIGMALPYVILTANPKWLDKMPKSGPGSELVKQVMGILLIAAAVFFLGSVPLNLASVGNASGSGISTVEITPHSTFDTGG